MVEGRVCALEQRQHRRGEVAGARAAADTAVLELHHLDAVLLDARPPDRHGVHVDVGHVVHQHGDSQALAVGQEVRERRGLPGSEKSAQQGGRRPFHLGANR